MKVVHLEGELDVFAAEALRDRLAAVEPPAVLDLSEVRLLTAAGLTEFVRLVKRVGPGRVALAGPPPHIRRILEIARFGELFAIVERADDFSPR